MRADSCNDPIADEARPIDVQTTMLSPRGQRDYLQNRNGFMSPPEYPPESATRAKKPYAGPAEPLWGRMMATPANNAAAGRIDDFEANKTRRKLVKSKSELGNSILDKLKQIQTEDRVAHMAYPV